MHCELSNILGFLFRVSGQYSLPEFDYLRQTFVADNVLYDIIKAFRGKLIVLTTFKEKLVGNLRVEALAFRKMRCAAISPRGT